MVLIGMLYAPLARETAIPFYRTKAFFASVRLAAAFLAVVAVSYAVAPDWMWMYYVRPNEVTAAGLLYVALVFYCLPYATGVFIGQHVCLHGQRRRWMIGVITCVIVQVALLVGWWQRYTRVGTAEEFFAGVAQPLVAAQPLNIILNVGTVVLAALAYWQWRALRKAGQSRGIAG